MSLLTGITTVLRAVDIETNYGESARENVTKSDVAKNYRPDGESDVSFCEPIFRWRQKFRSQCSHLKNSLLRHSFYRTHVHGGPELLRTAITTLQVTVTRKKTQRKNGDNNKSFNSEILVVEILLSLK
jgi:hypothetical protein